jgi:hypothetical protein
LRTATEAAEDATGEKVRFNDLFRPAEMQAQYRADYTRQSVVWDGKTYYPSEHQGGLAAPPGQSRHQSGEAADNAPGKALNWLHQHAKDYGLEFLQGTAFYKDPVHIQMAGTNTGMKPGEPLNPALGVQREFQLMVKDLRTQVGHDAEHEVADIHERVGKSIALEDGQVERLGNLIAMSGKNELLEKVEPDLRTADMRAQLPAGTSYTAVHSAVQAALSRGVADIPRRALETLDDSFKRDYEELQKNPLVYANKAGWTGPLNQIDPKNPTQVAQEISRRNEMADVVRDREPSFKGINVFGPDETQDIAKELTQGDPENAAKLMKSLQLVQPGDLHASISSGPIRDAIVGMAGSADPARMNAAMPVLDQQWRKNPAQFARDFGETASERLMAWIGLKDQFSAAEIAERLNSANDPDTAKGRADFKKLAEKELEGIDVAYEMGRAWWITPGFIARTIGTTPTAPIEGAGRFLPNAAMMADFSDGYTALRVYGIDPATARKQATQRLKETWGVSDIGGSRLMKYPPEAYYPAIDGSRGWMHGQLNASLDVIYPPKMMRTEHGEDHLVRSWQLAGLVADPKTEGEIGAGRAPSYLIAVTDSRGQIQLAPGPDGMPARFRWDPDAAWKAALPEMQVGVQRAQAGQRAWDAALDFPPMGP